MCGRVKPTKIPCIEGPWPPPSNTFCPYKFTPTPFHNSMQSHIFCFSSVSTLFPSILKGQISSVFPLFSLCFGPDFLTNKTMSSSSSSPEALHSHLGPLAPEPHPSLPWAQIDDQKKIGRRDSTTSGLQSSAGGGWDFLLKDGTKSAPRDFSKLSTSLLTATSLEMCTEILGCETGCHDYPVPDMCLQTTQERQCSSSIKPWKTREICKKTTTKHGGGGGFPPPLTSMSGGVRVQARRGGSRVVITSFFSRVNFKSERENGRLRLFLHNYKQSEQEFMAENIKENGGKIGCRVKCGDGSGSKNLTSLPVCVVAFT